MAKGRSVRASTEWVKFGYHLASSARDLLMKPGIQFEAGGIQQPRTFAAGLLARTVSNFRGCLLLIKAEQVVEAKTLVRSELENVLWLRRLVADPVGFTKQVKDDNESRDTTFAKLLRDQIKDELEVEDWHFLHEMASRPRKKTISPEVKPADTDDFREYAMYRNLSLDASHTSLRALARHFPNPDSQGRFIFSVPGLTSEDELAWTAYYANAALVIAMDLYVKVMPKCLVAAFGGAGRA